MSVCVAIGTITSVESLDLSGAQQRSQAGVRVRALSVTDEEDDDDGDGAREEEKGGDDFERRDGVHALAVTRRFFVGQWLDVKDTVNNWLEATVMDMSDSGESLGRRQASAEPPRVTCGGLSGRRQEHAHLSRE